MKAYLIIPLIVIAYFGAVNTVIASPTASTGSICKAKVKATSRSFSKGSAKKMARVFWRAKVIKKYGSSYAVWRSSINKSNSCKRKWGTKRCTVRATPCKTSLKKIAKKYKSKAINRGREYFRNARGKLQKYACGAAVTAGSAYVVAQTGGTGAIVVAATAKEANNKCKNL